MTEKEFVSAFIQQKEHFIKQYMFEGSNLKMLDLFEEWLKEKITANKNTSKPRNTKKAELNTLLDEVVNKAQAKLQKHGIKINCVSFNIPGKINKTARCLKVFPHESIFYRICKTSPRKGKYSGQNLIVIELVMDGHKNDVFIPLLAYKENMEKQLGLTIERERPTIEATGKYRLKLLVNFDSYKEKDFARQLSTNLAKFVHVTNAYLQKIELTR